MATADNTPNAPRRAPFDFAALAARATATGKLKTDGAFERRALKEPVSAPREATGVSYVCQRCFFQDTCTQAISAKAPNCPLRWRPQAARRTVDQSEG